MAVEGVILMGSRVKDVMTKDVVSVRETAGYKDIVAVMRELQISAFPVLDEEDHLVGLVSEADLLLKEIGQGALSRYLITTGRQGERAKAVGFTIAQLMSAPAVTIGPDDSVAGAAKLMHDRHVKRLPVVDDNSRVVGIVSRVDLLNVFDRPDDEIRDEVIKNVVLGEFAVDRDTIDVTVSSGVVTTAGRLKAAPSHAISSMRSGTPRVSSACGPGSATRHQTPPRHRAPGAPAAWMRKCAIYA
jgi:CBS domain-containing protein